MPSAIVRSFGDPDEFAASIRGTTSEMTVTEAGEFTAEIVRIDLHEMWLQRFSDNLARVRTAVPAAGRYYVSFLTQPGLGVYWDGVEMQTSAIIRHATAASSYQKSDGRAAWASMSLPLDQVRSLSASLSGDELSPPRDNAFMTPDPRTMARLQHLHAKASDLARDIPELIAHPEVARGLEQALSVAMIECVTNAQTSPDAAARRRHETIMRRFYAAVEQHPEEALYIPEICVVIGVPQRTLHVCCREHLGMSAKRYLLLRRMALARKALRQGDPHQITVTDIAARFGFWNFGRFAVEYRSIFSETPSATLHAPADVVSPSRRSVRRFAKNE